MGYGKFPLEILKVNHESSYSTLVGTALNKHLNIRYKIFYSTHNKHIEGSCELLGEQWQCYIYSSLQCNLCESGLDSVYCKSSLSLEANCVNKVSL